MPDKIPTIHHENEHIGPYVLIDPLGGGSFGEVWLARHTAWDLEFALKIPTDTDYVAQLQRESLIQFTLRHPNIVETREFHPEHSPPYFVMEYVEGQNLREHLAEHGRLPLADALSIVRQTLEALEAAHAEEVIHRDLKPANILLASDGTVKVCDFGIGAVQAEVTQSLLVQNTLMTQTGKSIEGTLEYMSPEQHEGEEPHPSDDLYALGIIGCELLTGSRPSGAGVATELSREGVPDNVVRVLAKACDRREYRYQRAAEMLADVAALEGPARQVAEVAAATEAAIRASRLDEAVDLVARLRQLGDLGEAAAERTAMVLHEHAAALRRSAEAALDGGDYARAAQLAGCVLAAERDSEDAQRLVDWSRAMAAADHPESGIRSSVRAGQYGDAREWAGELDQLAEAGCGPAARLRDQALAELRQEAERLARDAAAAVERGEVDHARSLLEHALTAQPELPQALALRDQIGQRVEVEALEREVDELIEAKSYPEARQAIGRLAAHSETGSQRAAAARQRLAARANELVAAARKAETESDPSGAAAHAREALRIAPRNEALSGLLARVESQARTAALCDEITGAMARKSYRGAARLVAELRSIGLEGPALAEPFVDQLAEQARQLRSQAVRSRQKGHLKTALSQLDKALDLTGDPALRKELRAARQAVRRKLARRGRLTEAAKATGTVAAWIAGAAVAVAAICLFIWALVGLGRGCRRDASEARRGAARKKTSAERGQARAAGTAEQLVSITKLNMGFQSALAAEMGKYFVMADARRALEVKFGRRAVATAGAGMFVWRAGPRADVVWVRPGGTLVAASRDDLSTRQRFTELKAAWHDVAQAVATVTKDVMVVDFMGYRGKILKRRGDQYLVAYKRGDLRRQVWFEAEKVRFSPAPSTAKEIQEAFLASAKLFSVHPGQYQRLCLRVSGGWPHTGDAVLHWPEVAPRWACLRGEGVDVLLDGRPVATRVENDPVPIHADLPQVQFGSHSVRIRGVWLLIHGFFQQPEGKITFGEGSRSILAASYSEALSKLGVPAPSKPPVVAKAGVTGASLGLHSALEGQLGAPLSLLPVRKALESKVQSVHAAANGALFVPQVGRANEAAWVFPDGRLVVGARQDIDGADRTEALRDSWLAVARVVAGVTASVPAAGLDDRLRRSAQFYTRAADQHQSIVADVPRSFTGWILNLPRSPHLWSRLSVFTFWNRLGTAVSVDGDEVTTRRDTDEPELVTVPLPRLAGGEHVLSGHNLKCRAGKAWIALEAYFAQPSSRITLYDRLGVLLTTRASYSRKLTALELPACRAYPAGR